MSPTLLYRLQLAEQCARRWSMNEKRHWNSLGLPASARWYGARAAWPDAVGMVRQDPAYWRGMSRRHMLVSSW